MVKLGERAVRTGCGGRTVSYALCKAVGLVYQVSVSCVFVWELNEQVARNHKVNFECYSFRHVASAFVVLAWFLACLLACLLNFLACLLLVCLLVGWLACLTCLLACLFVLLACLLACSNACLACLPRVACLLARLLGFLFACSLPRLLACLKLLACLLACLLARSSRGACIIVCSARETFLIASKRSIL